MTMKFPILADTKQTLITWQVAITEISAKLDLAWQTWTPDVTTSGGMVWTPTIGYYARYLEIPFLKLFLLRFRLDGTIGAPLSTDLFFSPPPGLAAFKNGITGSNNSMSVWISDTVTTDAGLVYITDGGLIGVRHIASANYVAGANAITVNGFYELE